MAAPELAAHVRCQGRQSAKIQFFFLSSTCGPAARLPPSLDTERFRRVFSSGHGLSETSENIGSGGSGRKHGGTGRAKATPFFLTPGARSAGYVLAVCT